MKKIPVWLISLLGGFCLSIPFLFDSAVAAPFAYVLGIPALYFLFRDVTGEAVTRYRSYLFRGFFFAYGFHLGVYHWFLYLYPLDFIADFTPLESVGVICVAWFGLSLIATACYAFIFPTFSIFARLPLLRRRPLLLPLLFAAVYTVFSALISLTWAGVPWGAIPITQTAYPYLIGTASLFGSYFTTFIIILVNGYLAFALLAFLRRPREERSLSLVRLPLTVALVAFSANFLAGIVIYHVPHQKTGEATVLLVQGNVSSRDRWSGDNESLQEKYDRIIRTAVKEADAQGRHPDLVIWSETAYPYTLSLSGEAPNSVTRDLIAFSRDLQVNNLVGAFSEKKSADGRTDQYNSTFLFRADGSISENVYSKRRLVPFGEFVPWKPFVTTVLPNMAKLVITNELVAGTDSAVFREEYGSFGTLICFDSIYAPLARDAVLDGAEALIIPTNDSWFGTSAALDQHHAQAILRAVENGRYVLRAGNTGITSIIDSRGNVLDTLPPLTEDTLLGTVELYEYKTLYSMIGDSFVWLAGIFVISLALPDLIFVIRRRRVRKEGASSHE